MSEVKSNKYTDNETGNAAGMMQLIQTISASNDATIDFTGIDGTYDVYFITGTNLVPAVDNNDFYVRTSIASSFKSGASDYSWDYFAFNVGGTGNVVDASDSEIEILRAIGNDAGRSMSFNLYLHGPSNTALNKKLLYKASGTTTAGVLQSNTGSGTYLGGTQAIDGIRFLFSGGNIASGEISLYGIKK